MKKVIKIVSALVLMIMLIGLILFGINNSEFTKLKKADTGGGFGSQMSRSNSKTYKRPMQINNRDKTMIFLGEFTTNMGAGERSKFIISEVSVKTKNKDVSYTIKRNSIVIRDIVIEELSHKSFSQISGAKGKERLKNDIKNKLNRVLGKENVEEVYFTKFIVQ